MKTASFALLTLLLSTAAHASGGPINCSTASGSVQLAGWNGAFLRVSVASENGTIDQPPAYEHLDAEALEIEEVSSRLIREISQRECKGEWGFHKLDRKSLATYSLKRKDGQAFPAGIEGLSADGLTLTVEAFCRQNVGGSIRCQK
jgi:hypothetical protein